MMNVSTYDERIVSIDSRKILSRSYLSAVKNHDDSSYSVCANIQLGLNDIPHILSNHYFRPAIKSKYKDRLSKFSLNEEVNFDQLLEFNKDIQNIDIAQRECVETPLTQNQSSTKMKRHPTAISRSNLGILNKRSNWREVGKSLILPTIVKSSENVNQEEVNDYEACTHEVEQLEAAQSQKKNSCGKKNFSISRKYNLKSSKVSDVSAQKQNKMENAIHEKTLNLSRMEKRNKSECKQNNKQKSNTRKSVLPYLSPDQNEIFQRFVCDDKVNKITSSRIKNKSIIRAINEQRISLNASMITQYNIKGSVLSDSLNLVVKGKPAMRQTENSFNIYV